MALIPVLKPLSRRVIAKRFGFDFLPPEWIEIELPVKAVLTCGGKTNNLYIDSDQSVVAFETNRFDLMAYDPQHQATLAFCIYMDEDCENVIAIDSIAADTNDPERLYHPGETIFRHLFHALVGASKKTRSK